MSKATTTKLIMDYLNTGNKLSVLEAVDLCHTVDLRRYITDIRRDGHNVKDEWCKNENTKKRFKRYWIEKQGNGQL